MNFDESFAALLREKAERYHIADFQFQVMPSKNKIKAEIITDDWTVRIYLPDFDFPEEVKDALGEFIINHELGHWRYCPSSGKDGAEIVDGVNAALKELNIKLNEDGVNLLVNIFEDFIDNVANVYSDFENSYTQQYKDGFRYFYQFIFKRGIFRESLKPKAQDRGLMVFVNVHQILFAYDEDKKIVSDAELTENEARLSEEIVKILIGDLYQKYKGRFNSLTSLEKREIVSEILDKEKWYAKTEEITKKLVPILLSNNFKFPVLDTTLPSAGARSEVDMKNILEKVDKLFDYLDKIYRDATKNNKVLMAKNPEKEPWEPKIGSILINYRNMPDADVRLKDLKWIKDDLVSLYRRENFGGSQFKRILFVIDSSGSMGWGNTLDLAISNVSDEKELYEKLKNAALNKGPYD